MTAPDTKILETLEELDTQLAEVAKTLEDRPAADTARQVLEDLQARVEELRQSPQSKEETLLALERLDQVAADASERRDTTASDALKRALSSLEQAALTREAARAAMDGDAAKLEDELKKLGEEFKAGGSFDEREVQRMAVRLQEAADALRQVGSAELADALEALAKALEEGDMVEAARLTEELASSEELQQLMRELQGDEALSEAGELLQQALASMGRPRPDPKRPGEGDPARGGIPVDWGVGTTNEAQPDRALGQQRQSDRQSAEISDWREAYEALAESQRLDGARGRSTRVQGQVGEGEFVAVPTRTVASGPQDAASPVMRVPARYEQAKEEALARDEVPAGYVDPVRRYFSQLGSGAAKQAPAPSKADDGKEPK